MSEKRTENVWDTLHNYLLAKKYTGPITHEEFEEAVRVCDRPLMLPSRGVTDLLYNLAKREFVSVSQDGLIAVLP